MNALDRIQEKLLQIKKLKGEIREEYETLFNDESLTLQERWDIFTQAGREGIFETRPWIQSFDSFKFFQGKWHNSLRDFLYEDYQRREIIDVENLAGRLDDTLEDGEENVFSVDHGDGTIKKVTLTRQMINDFKRECMKKLLYDFHFDW